MPEINKPTIDTNLQDNLIELNDKVTLYMSSKRAQHTPNQAMTPFHNSVGDSYKMSESMISKGNQDDSCQMRHESESQVLRDLYNEQTWTKHYLIILELKLIQYLL